MVKLWCAIIVMEVVVLNDAIITLIAAGRFLFLFKHTFGRFVFIFHDEARIEYKEGLEKELHVLHH